MKINIKWTKIGTKNYIVVPSGTIMQYNLMGVMVTLHNQKNIDMYVYVVV